MTSRTESGVSNVNSTTAPATERAKVAAHKAAETAAGKAEEVEKRLRSEAGRLSDPTNGP